MGTFDVIIIGLGGMGSAALYHLASRGARVLGIERIGVAHDRGSSHGQTRIYRKAYFEHPDYVPLLHRTYKLWSDLEGSSGRKLVHQTGLFLAGPPDGGVIPGVRRAAEEHHLEIESVNASDMEERFPGFVLSDNMEAVYEADAGYLAVEECVSAHFHLAISNGADVVIGQEVTSWSSDAAEVVVKTSDATHRAKTLIISAGPWIRRIAPEFQNVCTVKRKPVCWYPIEGEHYLASQGCPVFGFEIDEALFYGFPSLDGETIKVGEHSGGDVVDHPDHLDRSFKPDEDARVRDFLQAHLPHAKPVHTRHSVCMYTMSPDDHFIFGAHPKHSNVYVSAGFSGHGFKFAPVLGSALADLVMTGQTEEPIEFLSSLRPAVKTRTAL